MSLRKAAAIATLLTACGPESGPGQCFYTRNPGAIELSLELEQNRDLYTAEMKDIINDYCLDKPDSMVTCLEANSYESVWLDVPCAGDQTAGYFSSTFKAFSKGDDARIFLGGAEMICDVYPEDTGN